MPNDNNINDREVNPQQEVDPKAAKKQSKQEAGAKAAKLGAKAAGTYFGGSLGGKAVDIASKTKAGKKILDTAGKAINRNPLASKALEKANNKGLLDKADRLTNFRRGTSNKKNNPSGNNGGGSKSSELSKEELPNEKGLPNKDGLSNKNGLLKKLGLFGNKGLAKDDSVSGKVRMMLLLKKLLPLIIILIALIVIFLSIFVLSESLYAKMEPIYSVIEWFKGNDKDITDIAPKDSNQAKFMEKLQKYNEKSSCSNGLNMKLLLATLNYDDSLDKIYDEESEYTYEEEQTDEEQSEGEQSDDVLKDVKKRTKKLVKAMEQGNCADENSAYDDYLRDEYIPKYLSAYYTPGADDEEDQIQKIIDDIHEQVDAYTYWFEDKNECELSSGGTNCSYNVDGQTVSNVKVELINCNATKKSNSTVLMTLDLEDYIKGVVYAEVSSESDPEVQKAQAVAARTFAFTRGGAMCPSKQYDCFVGYQKETNTIRMRACENDQVYCDYKNGCSRGGGKVSEYVQGVPGWKSGLTGDALTTFENNLDKVAGQVLVDGTGNMFYTNFTQKSGQNQWAATVSSGGDYYAALQSFYGTDKEITSNCTASSDNFIAGIAGSSHLPITDYKRISSEYGERIHPKTKTKKMHDGIDYAAAEGTSIYAIADGDVTRVQSLTTGYGNNVIIGHNKQSDGSYQYYTLYAHMLKYLVKEGDHVNGGQEIGKVGTTGTSTGNHLHFEVRDSSNSPIDPNPTLDAIKANTGSTDNSNSSSNNSTQTSTRASEDIYYNQHDYNDAYCESMIASYETNGKVCHEYPATISTSGCSITSIAMAAATLNNNPSITPVTVADWVCNNTDYRVPNSGTKWQIYSDAGLKEKFGINVTKIWDRSVSSKPSNAEIMNKIKEALKANKMIIASLVDGETGIDYHGIEYHNKQDPGTDKWATIGGHYVVLSSINEEGQIKVLDSASRERTGYYDESTIASNYVGKINNGIWIIESSNSTTASACGPSNYTASGDYATWKQCGMSWSNDSLGSSSICKIGCAATSVAIQIARSGTEVTIPNLNPGTFVAHLSAHGGFAGNGIYWDAPRFTGLAPNFEFVDDYRFNPKSWSDVANKAKELIAQNYYLVITAKPSFGHYVAIDKVEGDTIYMFDPGSKLTKLNDIKYGPSVCNRILIYKKND